MKKTPRMGMGDRLRRERERRRWTQAELAERIGASVPSVQRWENGRAEPHADMLQALVALFGKPVDAWGASRARIWTVPYLRNLYFTGREATLASLHTILSEQNIAAVSQARAISGLGGIGKTQTALEYAYRYADEYDLVLWVRADSRAALIAQLAGLAPLLGLPDHTEADQTRLAKAVKRWLETHEEETWLLIGDNADDLAAVTEFLPTRGNGAILLTSRSHAVGKHMRKIELDKLTQEEGVQFLLARMGAAGKQALEALPAAERQAAEQLYTLMDGLPLALDQAAAYIEQYGCTLAEYLALYLQQRATFLNLGNSVDQQDYPDSVATTWLLSFQRVEQASPAAADLLRALAFLHPDAIPGALLLAGAAELGSHLQAMIENPALLQQAIDIVKGYSLIRHNPKTEMLSIHRLVQAVIQDGLAERERRVWAERAMLAVNVAFPQVEPETWPQCQRLLPHAMLAAEYIERDAIISEEAGRLLFETASYLQYRARYAEAEPLFQRALDIREQRLGSGHLDVAASLIGLADLHREQGKFAEAEPRFQRALRLREERLGSEHFLVAIALNNLANLYRDEGKYAEAETLYVRARRIWEQHRAPGDAQAPLPFSNLERLYAKLLGNLAALYKDQGRYAEAEPLYLRAIALLEQHVGGESLDAAYSLSNLATLYKDQERFAEAEPLYQRALRIWEQHLGPDHTQVALAVNNLGEFYKDQGRLAEAEPLYHRALEIYQEQFGPEHFLVAIVLNNQADIYREQGRYVEAESLYRRAQDVFERSVGSEHFLVAYPLNGLANLSREQGGYPEAEALYQRALRIREQAWGSEHPETAETMHDLALLREAQDNREEAILWYGRALAAREQALGAQHSKTTETRQRLDRLERSNGAA